MARAFHAHGATVLLADVAAPALRDITAELAGAVAIEYDQTDAGSIRALYANAKAGLVQFTRAAAELGPSGVRVAAPAPGRTRTPLNTHRLADEEELRRSLARIPARRIGEAREMARLAPVPASPLCDYVLGGTPIADGGYVLE